MTSHRRGFVGNQVQSDSIFLNTMHNILHYRKVVQNPGWQTSDPVLNAPETASLPSSAEVATSDTSEFTRRVWSNCSTEQQVPRRSALVASPLERCKRALTICRSDHNHRRIKDRLECNQPEAEHSRSMNERRKPDTHKPAGDESSSASIEDIGFLAEEHPHSVVHRQLDHNRLPEPQRGHALKGPVRPGCGDMVMVPGKRYIHSRRAYSWSLQLGSRCRLKDGYGPKWLEIDALNLCQATDDMGALEVDLFAAHHNKQPPRFFSFRPSRGRSSGCSSPNMVRPETISLSTIYTDRQVPKETDTGLSERDGNDSSILAKQDMVPKPAESADRSSSFATRQNWDHHESSRRIPPSGGAELLVPNCLQSVSSNTQDGGISEESLIISAAWRYGPEKSILISMGEVDTLV